MRRPQLPLQYEMPRDMDILEAYIHKNRGFNKSDFRKIKRSLRKLTAL